MFLISSLTLHVRLSRRWAFFCQSLTEINIAVQQLDKVGREVKSCTHIGGGHYVRLPVRGLSQMVPTARTKRPETEEKGDRSEPGSMGANEKARRGDKQRSSRSRHGATVLLARRSPRDVRMSRAIHSWSSHKIFQPIRSGTISKETQTLFRMHVGVSIRPSHVRRIQTKVAHLLLSRSSMSVLAQDVLPLQHIVHHSPSSGLWHC